MFSHEDLVARLTLVEHQYVERKSSTDKRGWLLTVVAFANSVSIGFPAVLFVGVSNAGEIQEGLDVEALMKSFSDYLAEHAYPPIYTAPTILNHGGRSCLAVIVPGSEQRPHFAGHAYIRDGTQTKKASEEKFRELVAQRLSKVSELLKWMGKEITVVRVSYPNTTSTQQHPSRVRLTECTAFYATFADPITAQALWSIPLASMEISFDHRNNTLSVIAAA